MTNKEIDKSQKEATSFGASEPTDGRALGEWKSRYPAEALRIIRFEAAILVVGFFFALLIIFLAWTGIIGQKASAFFGFSSVHTLNQYIYISFSGLLAGTVFSLKWLYHAVGRGIWHIDRQLWRFISPLMSFGVAFILGALLHANLLENSGDDSNFASAPALVSLGFISGYFSDAAIAKMYELATVLFGITSKPGKGNVA